MSSVPQGIVVGSLSSLNLCGDRGMRFGTAHLLVAMQHWVTLGWCKQWRQGNGVKFMMQWTAMLTGAPQLYDPTVQHQNEYMWAGVRATPSAFASRAVPASATPPPHPHRRHGGSCGGPNVLHPISDSDGHYPSARGLQCN